MAGGSARVNILLYSYASIVAGHNCSNCEIPKQSIENAELGETYQFIIRGHVKLVGVYDNWGCWKIEPKNIKLGFIRNEPVSPESWHCVQFTTKLKTPPVAPDINLHPLNSDDRIEPSSASQPYLGASCAICWSTQVQCFSLPPIALASQPSG